MNWDAVGAYIRQLSLEHDPWGIDPIVPEMDELVSNQGVQQFLASNKRDWRQ